MALADNIISHPKSQKSIPANVVTITPEMAAELLGKNVKNRKISKPLVESYARDMTSEKWLFTGEAIKLSSSGKLLDGQHRLLACIKADVPFTSLIIYELDDEAQDVLDTGRSRSVADVLTLQGHSHATRLASACRWMMNVKNGYARRKISHTEMLTTFRKHPGLNDSAHLVKGAYGMSQSLLTCIHYIGAELLIILQLISMEPCGSRMENTTARCGDTEHTWTRYRHAQRKSL